MSSLCCIFTELHRAHELRAQKEEVKALLWEEAEEDRLAAE